MLQWKCYYGCLSSAMYERASCCFKIRVITDLLYCYLMFEGNTQSYATFANNVII